MVLSLVYGLAVSQPIKEVWLSHQWSRSKSSFLEKCWKCWKILHEKFSFTYHRI